MLRLCDRATSKSDNNYGRSCPPVLLRRLGRGVTLIEVLIAIVIIAIASVGMASQFSVGLGSVEKQGDRRGALELARQQMEQLLADPVTVLPPSDGTLYYCNVSPCTSTSWVAGKPPRTVPVTHLGAMPCEVTGQWINDTTTGVPARQTVEFGVKVWFAPGSSDDDFHRVYLKTLRSV